MNGSIGICLGVWCLCVLKCDIHAHRTPNATIFISNAFDTLSLSISAQTVIVNFVHKRSETDGAKIQTSTSIWSTIWDFQEFFLDSNSLTHHTTVQPNTTVLHRIVLHYIVANQFRMKINCTNCATLWNTSVNDCMSELQLSFSVHLSSIFTAQNCFGIFFSASQR